MEKIMATKLQWAMVMLTMAWSANGVCRKLGILNEEHYLSLTADSVLHTLQSVISYAFCPNAYHAITAVLNEEQTNVLTGNKTDLKEPVGSLQRN
jgi:hypothetical protein